MRDAREVCNKMLIIGREPQKKLKGYNITRDRKVHDSIKLGWVEFDSVRENDVTYYV